MRSPFARLFVLIAPILVGLATSTLLLVDYVRALPVICAEGGGCDAIKRTDFARPFGIPTPLFGVLAFAVLGILVLLPGARARRLFVWMASVVGFVGVLLFGLQAKLGSFCVFCVITDVSAVLVLSVAFVRARIEGEVPAVAGPRRLAGSLVGLAFVVPLVVAMVKRPIVPPVIVTQLEAGPKGQAVLVDFVDFECPFCRMENAELEPLLLEHKERIHVVRKLVPLTRIHPHAMDAARAACCGERLGVGDAMASALFSAPVDELTIEGCAKTARTLGLDETAYRACIADPKTEDRIRADRETFDQAAAKGDGLPLMWVGFQKLMGLQDAETLKRALESAIARAGS